VKKLNRVVIRLQKDILAEISKETSKDVLTNYERIEDFVETLRMINEEFDEKYAIELSIYRNLLKDNDFYKKLPVRNE
jgi:hypothetical protein